MEGHACLGPFGRVFIPNRLHCQEVDPPPAGGTVRQNERKLTLQRPGGGGHPTLIPNRWCEIQSEAEREDVFPLESRWGWGVFLASVRYNLLAVFVVFEKRIRVAFGILGPALIHSAGLD